MIDKLLDELQSLGIDREPVEDNNSYVIELEGEDDWGIYFSLLDNSDLRSDVEEDELDLFHSKYTFYSKDFTYVLSSDFDKDEYELTITEREN